ncbi:hypothetical protein KPL71_023406 [Citrus sinensis]|uniref:Uncharacterized protein n=1 Tax=Citrus sinensis TaxID=2711 RepID=A0ACB8IIF5_CITSI|nr:hypothetical protein KPL71_023406 [Citrus sinensis]
MGLQKIDPTSKGIEAGVSTLTLFIMCAEAFSNLLIQPKRHKIIHGLKLDKQVIVSHLLFTDDSLIFTKASVEDCRNQKVIVDCYVAASGQIFNYEKSSMVFSGKLQAEQITTIKNIFQLNIVSKYEKYLGLPSIIGGKTMSFFNELKLKLLSKISNWQHKLFSSDGKEVLIKAVAQAVLAYAMSVFKVPLTLCENIKKAITKF